MGFAQLAATSSMQLCVAVNSTADGFALTIIHSFAAHLLCNPCIHVLFIASYRRSFSFVNYSIFGFLVFIFSYARLLRLQQINPHILHGHFITTIKGMSKSFK